MGCCECQIYYSHHYRLDQAPLLIRGGSEEELEFTFRLRGIIFPEVTPRRDARRRACCQKFAT